MIKTISMAVVLFLAIQVFAQEKAFNFKGQKTSRPDVNDIVRVFHPQAFEDRTGVSYDISSKSNLAAVCWNLGLGRRSAGAQYMESRIHRAVVVDSRGEVVAKVRDGYVLAFIDCFTWR